MGTTAPKGHATLQLIVMELLPSQSVSGRGSSVVTLDETNEALGKRRNVQKRQREKASEREKMRETKTVGKNGCRVNGVQKRVRQGLMVVEKKEKKRRENRKRTPSVSSLDEGVGLVSTTTLHLCCRRSKRMKNRAKKKKKKEEENPNRTT